MKPTPEQYEHFFRLQAEGRVTSRLFQRFLENPNRYNDQVGRFGQVYPVSVNRDLGLSGLIEGAN